MAPPDDGDEALLTLHHDGPGERAVARLRFGAAMLVVLCGAMLWHFDLGGVANAAIALAGLGAAGWLFVARRSLGKLPEQAHWSLRCTATELVLRRETTLRLPWASISAIVADEERLVVELITAGESPAISPVWCGERGRLGVHELATLLDGYRLRASASPAPCDD